MPCQSSLRRSSNPQPIIDQAKVTALQNLNVKQPKLTTLERAFWLTFKKQQHRNLTQS